MQHAIAGLKHENRRAEFKNDPPKLSRFLLAALGEMKKQVHRACRSAQLPVTVVACCIQVDTDHSGVTATSSTSSSPSFNWPAILSSLVKGGHIPQGLFSATEIRNLVKSHCIKPFFGDTMGYVDVWNLMRNNFPFAFPVVLKFWPYDSISVARTLNLGLQSPLVRCPDLNGESFDNDSARAASRALKEVRCCILVVCLSGDLHLTCHLGCAVHRSSP